MVPFMVKSTRVFVNRTWLRGSLIRRSETRFVPLRVYYPFFPRLNRRPSFSTAPPSLFAWTGVKRSPHDRQASLSTQARPYNAGAYLDCARAAAYEA